MLIVHEIKASRYFSNLISRHTNYVSSSLLIKAIHVLILLYDCKEVYLLYDVQWFI